MNFFKKYRFELLIYSVIIFLYFTSRLIQLGNTPIFTDEAIYIRWAQIAQNDANWRFISLTDGKQPSFVWVAMVLMRFISDPLIASRMVSVFAGFASLIGLFFLGKEVFKNRWIGILSSVVYLLSPFALVYDRLALYEAMVAAFFVWALYLTVLLIRYIRLDTALLLGLTIAGAVLTKANGFYSLYLIPFSLLLFDWKSKKRFPRFVKLAGLTILVVVMTYGFYSILRLSPFFHIIDQKTAIFVYPLTEWLTHPFMFFWGNILVGQWDWLWRYITPPLLALAVASFFIERKFTREKITLFLWFFLPYVGLALFGKVLYPRYIFSMVMALFPLIAFSLYFAKKYIKNNYLYALFLLVAFSYALFCQFKILTDFTYAPLPSSDIDQYVRSWPAGLGNKEAVAFFTERAKEGKIHVVTQGTFGLYPYAFEIYLKDNPNIVVSGFWPTQIPFMEEVIKKHNLSTYVVFYQPCVDCQGSGFAPINWPLTLVKRYEKGDKDTFLSIFKYAPESK